MSDHTFYWSRVHSVDEPIVGEEGQEYIYGFFTDFKPIAAPPPSPPPCSQREIVTPGAGGVEVPVDKTKYRIKYIGETENHVDIIIEPKD